MLPYNQTKSPMRWIGSASRLALLMVTIGTTAGMLLGKFPVEQYNVLATMCFSFYFGQKALTPPNP